MTDTTVESLDVPVGLAFDKQGNLWVANLSSDQNGSVDEFAAADLSANGSPQPAVFLDSNTGGIYPDGPFMISVGPVLT